MGDRYRRKPTAITAVRWDGGHGDAEDKLIALGAPIVSVEVFTGTLRLVAGPGGESGQVNVPVGSWVATDGQGDWWPIAHEQFTATYEEIPDA